MTDVMEREPQLIEEKEILSPVERFSRDLDDVAWGVEEPPLDSNDNAVVGRYVADVYIAQESFILEADLDQYGITAEEAVDALLETDASRYALNAVGKDYAKKQLEAVKGSAVAYHHQELRYSELVDEGKELHRNALIESMSEPEAAVKNEEAQETQATEVSIFGRIKSLFRRDKKVAAGEAAVEAQNENEQVRITKEKQGLVRRAIGAVSIGSFMAGNNVLSRVRRFGSDHGLVEKEISERRLQRVITGLPEETQNRIQELEDRMLAAKEAAKYEGLEDDSIFIEEDQELAYGEYMEKQVAYKTELEKLRLENGKNRLTTKGLLVMGGLAVAAVAGVYLSKYGFDLPFSGGNGGNKSGLSDALDTVGSGKSSKSNLPTEFIEGVADIKDAHPGLSPKSNEFKEIVTNTLDLSAGTEIIKQAHPEYTQEQIAEMVNNTLKLADELESLK